jgi:hypothetical protein
VRELQNAPVRKRIEQLERLRRNHLAEIRRLKQELDDQQAPIDEAALNDLLENDSMLTFYEDLGLEDYLASYMDGDFHRAVIRMEIAPDGDKIMIDIDGIESEPVSKEWLQRHARQLLPKES